MLMRISYSLIVGLLLLCLCSGLVGGLLVSYLVEPSEVVLAEIEDRARHVALQEVIFSDRLPRSISTTVPTDFIAAANTARPAVVFIRALTEAEGSTRINRIFNSSTGSGVLVSGDGYIVTNQHVIQGADKVEIVLNDKREYLADVVGGDLSTDLAVLKINMSNAPHLTFGDSDAVSVGEWVLAVGNPLKLTSTVTAGIVSAKGRSIELMGTEGIESFIQTDAAVNPGNSGGALVNTAGRLIGINTAILTKSGGYEGFSFAVPINLAKKIIADIIEYGAVQRGWMGVRINNVDANIANDIDLAEVSGVLLSGFTSGSAAKESGLVLGDVIVGINGIDVSSVPEFTEQVGRYRPGDELEVSFLRDNQRENVTVTLKNNLNTTDFVAVRKDKVLIDLGIEVRDMDSSEKAIMQLSGAYVVSVYQGSTIGNTNLEPGYIVTMANRTNIQSAEDLVAFLKEEKGTVVLEGYYQNYPGKFPYTFENE